MAARTKSEETKPAFLQGSSPCEVVHQLALPDGEVIIEKIMMAAFEGRFLNWIVS